MLITFDTGITGLTPGYTVLNSDGSEYAARTAVGVSDRGGGCYGVEVADATIAGRTILWDTGTSPAQYASESFPASLAYAGTLTSAYDAAKTAAAQTDVTAILAVAVLTQKWIEDKLVATDNGDGTVTYRLYDTDDTTPLKTWVVTTATGTRAKAT